MSEGLRATGMSGDQWQVTETGRHRRLLLARTASLAVAACLVIALLWGAGLPTQWLERLHGWLSPLDQSASTPASAVAPHPAPTAAPSITIPGSVIGSDPPAGTTSTVSTIPQPLFLIATTPGRNKNEGTALIGTNPENPQTYLAGAILANGARVAEIHRDYVILARGADSAKMHLYRRDGSAQAPRNALLRVGGETKPPRKLVSTREVLTDYLRPTPVYDGEMLRGYQVYPGPKASVFSLLGLQSGDVITSLNDLPFADSMQAMESFNQLTRGIAVIATVERRGAKQRITLDGALISVDQESAATAALGAPAIPSM